MTRRNRHRGRRTRATQLPGQPTQEAQEAQEAQMSLPITPPTVPSPAQAHPPLDLVEKNFHVVRLLVEEQTQYVLSQNPGLTKIDARWCAVDDVARIIKPDTSGRELQAWLSKTGRVFGSRHAAQTKQRNRRARLAAEVAADLEAEAQQPAKGAAKNWRIVPTDSLGPQRFGNFRQADLKAALRGVRPGFSLIHTCLNLKEAKSFQSAVGATVEQLGWNRNGDLGYSTAIVKNDNPDGPTDLRIDRRVFD